MYESPINFIHDQIRLKLLEEEENKILQAVQKTGVFVDKEELIKALAYDREQYQKGYQDRDGEIVRCDDCKKQAYCHETVAKTKRHDGFVEYWTEPIEWCSKGERKDGER